MYRYVRKQIKRVLSEAVIAAVARRETSAKWSPSSKASQIALHSHYQQLARTGAPLPPLRDTGYRVFSQFDEDGLLLFLFAVLGSRSKIFIDIGSADGINSNCANLAVNFGWHGLFIDSSQQKINRGREFYAAHPDTALYPPRFLCSKVARNNVNSLIEEAGFNGEIDLMSIDIDGNDYWVWDALECVDPRIVIIETRSEFGMRNVVVPYDEKYAYPGTHPEHYGASPVAMTRLASQRGYRLVGANRFGFNLIYIKVDESVEQAPEVSVESILDHPRTRERFQLFEPAKTMPFVEGGTPFPGRPAHVD